MSLYLTISLFNAAENFFPDLRNEDVGVIRGDGVTSTIPPCKTKMKL